MWCASVDVVLSWVSPKRLGVIGRQYSSVWGVSDISDVITHQILTNHKEYPKPMSPSHMFGADCLPSSDIRAKMKYEGKYIISLGLLEGFLES